MDQLTSLIIAHGYALLFPISIAEGPIATVIGGFLVSLGLLNALYVYLIVVAGDVIGDTILYVLGRYDGKHFFSIAEKYFGVTNEKLEKARIYFNDRKYWPFISAKLLHGIGFAGLVAAGSLRVPYKKYAIPCFITSVVQSAILLVVGILFGHAYLALSKYFNYFATITLLVGVGILFYFGIKKFRNKN